MNAVAIRADAPPAARRNHLAIVAPQDPSHVGISHHGTLKRLFYIAPPALNLPYPFSSRGFMHNSQFPRTDHPLQG